MTGLALVQRRWAIRLAALRWETLAAAILGIAAAVVLAGNLLSGSAAQADAEASGTAVIAPAQARALLAATAGAAASEVRATGSEAEKMNAALPFSKAPVQAAVPFEAPTGGTSYDRALTCLTQAVYYEAGFEPLAGRRAVAQVVLNRTRHPAFPKSVCGVVYQRNSTPVCQFTFVCDGSLARPAAAAAWAEARKVAAAALAGYVEPSVGQATHYHANYVSPYWAPMLAKITQVGAHIFYRWPGAWGLRSAFTGRYAGEPSDPSALRPASGPGTPAAGDAQAAQPLAPAALTFEQDKTVRRAANDVGGLLDTSKGWRLTIPGPEESASRTRALLAEQGAAQPSGESAAAAATIVTAGGGPAALATP